MQVGVRGHLPSLGEHLKHAEVDSGRAKAIKILPCAGLFLTTALWQDYKMLQISTHLGIRTALPNDARGGEKTSLHPSCFWIIYFNFFLWVKQKQEHV